jgi:hypothetical protein
MPWRHMGEWRYSSTILDLGTRWMCVASFKPLPLYPRGYRPPGTHWTGSWVGPRAGLNAVGKRKILHSRGSNPGRPARRYTDWAIPTLFNDAGRIETIQRRWYDDSWMWEVGGIRIRGGNRSTRRKAAPVPLCPPQIPHDLTGVWTVTSEVGSRQLVAWATTRTSHRPLILWRYFG